MDDEITPEEPTEPASQEPISTEPVSQEPAFIGNQKISNYRGSDWVGNTQITKEGKYANVIHDSSGRAISITMPDGTEKNIQRDPHTGKITGIEGEGNVYKGADVNQYFDRS